MTISVLIAVGNDMLHPEAMHLAAATGLPLHDVSQHKAPAEHIRQALAHGNIVLVDAHFAHHIDTPSRASSHCFFLHSGLAAQEEGFAHSFVIPEQAGQLLRAIGQVRSRPVPAPSGGGGSLGRVIGVVGAAGGVGASVLAASISRCAAARDISASLVDAHPHSGGLDLLLGAEEHVGARWGDIVVGEGVVEREDVRRALPRTAEEVAVMTFPRSKVAHQPAIGAQQVHALVAALRTAGVTVVDAPFELLPDTCDAVIIVVPPLLRAVSAAAQLVARCEAAGMQHCLVLREAVWAGLSADEVAAVTGSRVIATLPEIRSLTKSVETRGLTGRLPRALAQVGNAVLECA